MSSQHVPMPIWRVSAGVWVLQRNHFVSRWLRWAATSLRIQHCHHKFIPKTRELCDGERKSILSAQVRQRSMQKLSNRLLGPRRLRRWKRRAKLFSVSWVSAEVQLAFSILNYCSPLSRLPNSVSHFPTTHQNTTVIVQAQPEEPNRLVSIS